MNSAPIVLRLVSGSADAVERLQEGLRGVGVDQRDVVVVAEQADHLLALVEPQQAVVDEHALQLVADRLVQQHGHDR